jgi:MFS family permease
MRSGYLNLGELLHRRAPRATHARGRPTISDNVTSPGTADPVIGYLQALLKDTREDLVLADSKAALLLASSGVAVGALLAGLLGGGWTPFKLDIRIQWIWWLGVCFASAGILFIAAAVYPRIHRKATGHPGLPTYYGDISKYDDVEAFRLAVGLTPSLERRLLDQTFLLSRSVQSKYILLQRGLLCLLVAIVACISSVLINIPFRR